MKMCSPPSVGSTFSKNDFLQISCARRCFHTQTALNTTTFREAFPPCAVQKNIIFCRLSGKWPTLEALFNTASAFACISNQIFISSVLILPLFLGRFVDRRFYLRLHSGFQYPFTMRPACPKHALSLIIAFSKNYTWPLL